MQQGSISRVGGTYTVRFKDEGGEASDVAQVDVSSLRPATNSEVTVIPFLRLCCLGGPPHCRFSRIIFFV